jgi:hypothetical protein
MFILPQFAVPVLHPPAIQHHFMDAQPFRNIFYLNARVIRQTNGLYLIRQCVPVIPALLRLAHFRTFSVKQWMTVY